VNLALLEGTGQGQKFSMFVLL